MQQQKKQQQNDNTRKLSLLNNYNFNIKILSCWININCHSKVTDYLISSSIAIAGLVST